MTAWFKTWRKAKSNSKLQKVADPVCNMKIEPGVFSSNHNGKVYYFCSDYCKQQFDADPNQYI